MQPVEISAGRLHLRPWTAYDEEAILTLFQDAETARWTPVPVPFTPEDGRARLTELFPGMWESGKGAPFAVLDAVTAEVLAWVAVFDVEGGRAEVGWAALPAARGKGVTSEAVATLCRWAFATFDDLEVLQATIAVGNWASLAVAQRCGFTVEGVRRRAMTQRGTRLDAWTCSLLRGEDVADRRPVVPRTLTDGVVTLRPFRPEDADDVARACDDPVSARWLPLPSPYTREDGVTYVSEIVPQGWAAGTEATFAVTDAATGELLGDCGLKLQRRALGLGEVGYWTAPWARGKGVATRAARLVARWGLEDLGLHRVEVVADVENVASVRAAQAAGFVREGVARCARPDRHGVAHDMVQLSLVPADLGGSAG